MGARTIAQLIAAGFISFGTTQGWARQADATTGNQGTGGGPVCREAGQAMTFRVNSTALDDAAKASLDGVLNWLQGDDSRWVRLEGFTDKSGDPTHNEVLSQKRAAAARAYLIRQGIDPKRIEAVGHGQFGDRMDLEDMRAVAITMCQGPMMAMGPATQAGTPAADQTSPSAATGEGSASQQEMAEQTGQARPADAQQPASGTEQAAPPPVVVVTPPASDRSPAGGDEGGAFEARQRATEAGATSDRPLSVIGVAASAGGGVVRFVENGARAVTDTGGQWEARLTIGTRLPVALEAAYIGTAQNVNALGLSENAVLMGNGAEANLRLNLLPTRVQPYLFGGVGWMHYSVRNTNVNTSSIRSNDDIVTVPFGVGLALRLSRSVLFDVRGTGRATFYEQLFDQAAGATGQNDRLHSWNVAGKLGFEF